MSTWNNKVKRLLKSELVKRGISNDDLCALLLEIGVEETKSSINSKISRGTFSAAFFMQCLVVIGCKKIEIEENNANFKLHHLSHSIAAEPSLDYIKKDNGEN